MTENTTKRSPRERTEREDAADEKSIRETVRQMEATWNRHDMAAYAALLSDDVEWINIVGMWWRGKRDVHKAHEAFHQTTFRDISIHLDEVAVRRLAPDLAVAVCTETKDPFTTPSGHRRPETRDRLTLVLRRSPESESAQPRWRICHGHNTEIDPEAARHNPIHS